MDFKLQAPFIPMGDQPEAIRGLVDGIKKGFKHQVLLGATGTLRRTPALAVGAREDQVRSSQRHVHSKNRWQRQLSIGVK